MEEAKSTKGKRIFRVQDPCSRRAAGILERCIVNPGAGAPMGMREVEVGQRLADLFSTGPIARRVPD
jgi:hypothetical protein